MPSIEYDDVYKRALAKINDLDLFIGTLSSFSLNKYKLLDNVTIETV